MFAVWARRTASDWLKAMASPEGADDAHGLCLLEEELGLRFAEGVEDEERYAGFEGLDSICVPDGLLGEEESKPLFSGLKGSKMSNRREDAAHTLQLVAESKLPAGHSASSNDDRKPKSWEGSS